MPTYKDPQLKERFSSAKKQLEQAQGEMEKIAKTFLTQESKAIFEAHPVLVAYRWNQFTPSWNDGCPCEFGVNEPFFKFKDVNTDDPDYDGEEDGFQEVYDYKNSEHPEDWRSAAKAVTSLLNKIGEDNLEDMFGNGYQITVSTKGIKVEDYDEDY